MVCLASVSRAAIVLRIPSSLISSYSRPSYMAATASADGPVGAGAAAGAADAGVAVSAAGLAPGCAASTSALTIRPCGPEPDSAARSIPFCAAIRRASGEAKMRPPSAVTGAGGAACSEPPAGAASAAASAGCAASGAGAGVALDASMSSALSPSSRSTAMAVLTFTASVPSGTRILPITPSSTASNSIVALSVSISASKSPDDTVSPSLTSHFASVPSSIVGDSAGMRISTGMSASLPIGDLLDGGDHLFGGHQRQLFQVRRIGHGHVLAGAVDHRRVEIVERLL